MEPNKRRLSPTASTLAATAPPLPPSHVSPEWSLPLEILLDIAARLDATTLVRCAAACKPLHREILTLGFLSRICSAPPGLVPTRLHSYLDKTFCLQEHNAAGAAAAAPSAEKKKKHLPGFVCRSSWSWEALSTRWQDDEAERQEDEWRQALKTLYINSHILGY